MVQIVKKAEGLVTESDEEKESAENGDCSAVERRTTNRTDGVLKKDLTQSEVVTSMLGTATVEQIREREEDEETIAAKRLKMKEKARIKRQEEERKLEEQMAQQVKQRISLELLSS